MFAKESRLSQLDLGTVGIVLLALVMVLLGTSAVALGADEANATTSGSGKEFKTTITRQSEGELNNEDLRQASLLASQVVRHVGTAAQSLMDDRADHAKLEAEKATKLIEVIRKLLPVTEVTTVVTDARGKEVYRDAARIQDDRIPIYQEMVAVKVIEAVTEAKQQEATLKGFKLADADLVHTSVLVDLAFIERKLNRALERLAKNEILEAKTDLQLAQTKGVEFVIHENDHPLWQAQAAIELAERLARDGRFDSAKSNLTLARAYLDTYRTLVGTGEADKIGRLSQQIDEVSQRIEKRGAADEIREFWHRITSWFQGSPGRAEVTPADAKDSRLK